MRLSVIICSFGRVEESERCINSMVRQVNKNFEIVLVDNKGEVGLENLVSNFEKKLNLKYYWEHRVGLAHARNIGAKISKGEYLAYIDDDAVASPDWTQKILEKINKKSPYILGGPIYPFYTVSKPEWFRNRYETRSHGSTCKVLENNNYLSGSNFIVNKQLLKKIGFDVSKGMKGDKIGGGEEVVFQKHARELGIEILYDPNIQVKHAVTRKNTSLIYKLRRAYNFGKNMAQTDNSEIKCIRMIYDLAIATLRILFRDKKKFPYWQQYVYEKISVSFYRLGVCFG